MMYLNKYAYDIIEIRNWWYARVILSPRYTPGSNQNTLLPTILSLLLQHDVTEGLREASAQFGSPSTFRYPIAVNVTYIDWKLLSNFPLSCMWNQREASLMAHKNISSWKSDFKSKCSLTVFGISCYLNRFISRRVYLYSKTTYTYSIKIIIVFFFLQRDPQCGRTAIIANFDFLNWRQCSLPSPSHRLALARCVGRAIRNCCNKYGV